MTPTTPRIQLMNPNVIVLGAGLAGLAAARKMRSAGLKVAVLEKSRGLGGRAATRRWEGFPVDHGAQFFTVRDPEFGAQVQRWLEQNVCHEWTRGFHQHRGRAWHEPAPDAHPRYACREGMSALGRALTAGLEDAVQRRTKVIAIGCEGETWRVSSEDGQVFRACGLVVTAPAPQAMELLRPVAPDASAFLASIPMAPCLAVVARFPRRGLGWRGVQTDDDMVAWIGHDTSKRPELHADKTIVVLHATPDFSQKHLGSPETEVAAAMLERASCLTSEELSDPEAMFVQRWRYALPVNSPGAHTRLTANFAASAPLVLAGDGVARGKIEGAWLSGEAAAAQMITALR